MTMPSETSGTFRLGIVVLCIFAALALYTVILPENTGQSLQRLTAPLANVAPPTRVHIGNVTPGNTEVLFGRPLQVTAEIRGLLGSEQPQVVIQRGSAPLRQILMETEGRGDVLKAEA